MIEAYHVPEGLYSTEKGTSPQISKLEQDIRELEEEIERTDITNGKEVEQLRKDYQHVLEEVTECGLDKRPIRKVVARRLGIKTKEAKP